MTFGELLAQMLGWLGEFIQWILEWIPRYEIIRFNERGVKYTSGRKPKQLNPGIRWYWPLVSEIVLHEVARMVVNVTPLTLETKDGKPATVGMVVTGHIVDIVRYEVENADADESMAEVARAGLREIVTGHTWEELCSPAAEGSRLESKLANRMNKALARFGFEVESCRPTDQVRVGTVARLFGVNQHIFVAGGE